MNKKRLISVLLMFLLVLSLLVYAEEETSESSCSGFFGSISCFLWGNPENRAGRGWFEGRSVVGESGEYALPPTIPIQQVQQGQSITLPNGVSGVVQSTSNIFGQITIVVGGNSYNFQSGIEVRINPSATTIVTPFGEIPAYINAPSSQPSSQSDNVQEAGSLQANQFIVYQNQQVQILSVQNDPSGRIVGTYLTENGEQNNFEFLSSDTQVEILPPPSSTSTVASVPSLETPTRAPAGPPIRTIGTAPSPTPSGTTPAPASSQIVAAPDALKVPSYLYNQIFELPEGTIVSSTSGATFTVKNGRWRQFERARGSTEREQSFQNFPVDQSELAVLNDLQYYEGKNKKLTLIPPVVILEQARLDLGQTVYDRVKSNIDWYQTLKAENKDNKNYIVPNTDLAVKDNKDGTTSVTLRVYSANNQLDKEKTQTYTVVDGQDIFIQSEAQKEKGIVKLADSKRDVYVGKLDTKDLKKGITYYENEQAFKDKDPLGKQEVKEGVITNTHFKEGSQKITNTRTGETQDLTGSYDKDDKQFTARGGEYVDASGIHYGIDYDYSGSGKDRKLEGREIYDKKGRFAGIMQEDGMVVIAQTSKTGEVTYVTTAKEGDDHRRIVFRRNAQGGLEAISDSRVEQVKLEVQQAETQYTQARTELGNVIQEEISFQAEFDAAKRTYESADRQNKPAAKEVMDNWQAGLNTAKEKTKEANDKAETAREEVDEKKSTLSNEETKSNELKEKSTLSVNELENSITGWQRAQTAVESIYAVTRSVKDYPALTRLFGLPNWQTEMDKQFAPLLGSNWFPSAICEGHYDIEPEGFAMIKTVSGTYQAVAGIQMERSASTSPILCQRNPDTAAEEQFICDQRYVCINDGFCFADADEDEEPDSEQPAQGYFYKITWGVTAPRDEAFTPLLDENGVAVSFNVWLDKTPDGKVQTDAPNGMYMYQREGDITSPIKLKNGENDKDVIIHYSPNLYEEACIRWGQPPSTVQMREGRAEGRTSQTFFGSAGEAAKVAGAEFPRVIAGPLGVVGAGGVIGTEDVGDVCFTVDVSSIGQVNWERAGQPQSVTVQAGEVQRNRGW